MLEVDSADEVKEIEENNTPLVAAKVEASPPAQRSVRGRCGRHLHVGLRPHPCGRSGASERESWFVPRSEVNVRLLLAEPDPVGAGASETAGGTAVSRVELRLSVPGRDRSHPHFVMGESCMVLLVRDKPTASGRATLGAKPFRRAPK